MAVVAVVAAMDAVVAVMDTAVAAVVVVDTVAIQQQLLQQRW